MPGLPSSCVERGGALPAAPASGRTLASPRQTGVVGVGVRDGDGVRERDAVRVVVALPVPAAVADSGALPEPDGLRVALALPEGDGEPLPECGALALPEGLARGLPDALRSDAMPRPRYVRLATAASASPASHSSADSSTPDAMVLDGTSCVTLAYAKHGDGMACQRRAVSCSANA